MRIFKNIDEIYRRYYELQKEIVNCLNRREKKKFKD